VEDPLISCSDIFHLVFLHREVLSSR